MIYEKSVEYLFPEVAKEWNYKKNGDLKPSDVTFGSHKKVWWLGECGHEWEAVVKNRCQGRTKCPICYKNKRIKGYISENTELMKEWSFEDNRNISPEEYTIYSKQIVTWKCKHCGNKWEATIGNRSKGNGCPNCNRGQGKRRKDFVEKYPELLKEWDYEKNKGIDINKLGKGSNYKAFWKCAKGHSWQTEVRHRTHNNSKCPYCAGQRAITGENDLITLNPSFLKEWDYEKNSKIGINPKNMTLKCQKLVYWKCNNGHSWKTSPSHRTKSKTGCPYCMGQKPIDGINDLKKANPPWLKYWDYEKNKKKPEEYMLFSHARVNWKCEENHTWTRLISKMSESPECPYCKGVYPVKGINDFETLHPELMLEWYYEKNIRINPSDVTEFSNKYAFWKCEKGHVWRTQIKRRSKGSNCPICARK